eukprot:CAMPEP_0170538454 /NCGR_PEP_ID=MMETSP0209-20121228/103320_1 /TAXON_ID=665100 ORGANISM="Litonotus pictus, Strain P1" /NCGR_SAMPLE_ID=MMETSP0209 /ASSEMBLY_ACC=CAM_ASM_000301 /LENGTH=195 /DNA_ID=CAMNT_0010840147 /DNA_START=562 /DNA_END=1146 /DNA_ORIENTATION=+
MNERVLVLAGEIENRQNIISVRSLNTLNLLNLDDKGTPQDGYSTLCAFSNFKYGVSALVKWDYSKFIAAFQVGVIGIYDIYSKMLLGVLEGHPEPPTSILKLNDKELLSTSYSNVRVWNIDSQECTSNIEVDNKNSFSLVHGMNNNSSLLLCANFERSLDIVALLCKEDYVYVGCSVRNKYQMELITRVEGFECN